MKIRKLETFTNQYVGFVRVTSDSGEQGWGQVSTYHADSGKYEFTPEQAMMFAHEESPAFVVGGFQIALAAGRAFERLKQSFVTGEGIGWHEHDHGVFHGCARFFRPGYIGNLVQHWIPSLDGVKQRLEAGIRVADVGCGYGYSTILMAQAFPKSKFTGFDYHRESIDAASVRGTLTGFIEEASGDGASTGARNVTYACWPAGSSECQNP